MNFELKIIGTSDELGKVQEILNVLSGNVKTTTVEEKPSAAPAPPMPKASAQPQPATGIKIPQPQTKVSATAAAPTPKVTIPMGGNAVAGGNAAPKTPTFPPRIPVVPAAQEEDTSFTDPFGDTDVDVDALLGGNDENDVPSFPISSHIAIDKQKNTFTYDGAAIPTGAIRVAAAELVNSGKRAVVMDTIKQLGYADFNSMLNAWEKKEAGALENVATFYDTIKRV